jgi:F0F1-type ATP synthase membrane subunit b/b'
MIQHLRIEVFLLTINLVLFVMWCAMALWNALRKWLGHL